MNSELHLPYDLDKKSAESAALKEALLNDFRYRNIVITKLEEQGVSPSLSSDAIIYYALGSGNYQNDIASIQKTIRLLIKVAKECMQERYDEADYEALVDSVDYVGKVKRIYKAPSTQTDSYELLMRLNLPAIQDRLLSSGQEKIYDSLLQVMRKYKLYQIPDCFSKLLESEYINLPFEPSCISDFISYYYQIYEAEKKRLSALGKTDLEISLTPTTILINACIFSSVSSIYSQILGVEDAQLIRKNPGPNAAGSKLANNERLEEAIRYTLNNYRRQEVTIPTFNEVIDIGNHKCMRAIVGNFTHSSNITHGERTGACMRIGGMGETLWKFCLEDKNGFHIRFENPYTGEYISRVSGFRNGNTVFLNELRYSCNLDDYSNEDVVSSCRLVANILLQESKDSSCPIENVVIHPAYAMCDYQNTAVYLNISSPKEGLKSFYSDVSSIAVVLATTSTDAAFAPVNFDKSNVPVYQPARECAKESTNVDILNSNINRVHSIHQALSGQNYKYIEPITFQEGFLYGIVGQDWYLYVDANQQVHEDLISIDKRAEEELKIARKKAQAYISEKREESTYGI